MRVSWVWVWVLVGCGGSSGGGGGGGPAGPLVPPPASTACTATITVPDTSAPTAVVGSGTAASVTQSELQTALDGGGVVVIDTGGEALSLPLTAPLQVTVDVVLEGNGDVTLDGQGASRIFEKSSGTTLELVGLGLTRGRAADRGGAVFGINGGIVRAFDCVFQSNTTAATGPDIGGGAIYLTGHEEVLLARCAFTSNQGSNGGAIGGIGNTLHVLDCTFDGNQALGAGSGQGGIGGAIYMDGVHQNGVNAEFEACGCVFTDNVATDHGGAVFAFVYPGTGSSATYNACTFEGNEATAGTGQGGAVYHQNEALTVNGCTFVDNTATRQGGGLWLLTPGSATVVNTTFSQNRVTTPMTALGGGIAISQGTVSLLHVTFFENHAEHFAGGLFASSTAVVTVQGCLFDRNTGVEPFNGLNVNRTLDVDGGGNIQIPDLRPNGTTDTRVTPTVVVDDPVCEPLADNGGAVRTHRLPAGSPARDLAPTTGAPSTDARGQARSDGAPDAGAVEE